MWIEDSLYNTIKKVMPIPTVDIVVIRKADEKVLLLRRNNEPAKDKWWIIGGRINRGETILAAAYRKLKEETGIRTTNHLDTICGAISVDYGSSHTITVTTYRILLDENPKIVLNSEHTEFLWASKKEAIKLLVGQAKIQYIAATMKED